MKRLKSAILYMGLALVANPLWADGASVAELEALREGSMKKLIFSEPVAASNAPFVDLDGNEFRLSDYRGKYLLVNFWATWCAPCRKEMPWLDTLNMTFGGDRFEVLTIALRSQSQGMRKFFEDTQVQSLPLFLDKGMDLSRNMGILALPITVLLDPDGNEIARVRGDADWQSESAQAIIAALIGAERTAD